MLDPQSLECIVLQGRGVMDMVLPAPLRAHGVRHEGRGICGRDASLRGAFLTLRAAVGGATLRIPQAAASALHGERSPEPWHITKPS